MSNTNDDRLNGLYQSMLADLSTTQTLAGLRLKDRARKRMRFSVDKSAESLDNFRKFNEYIGAVNLDSLDNDIIVEAKYFIERKMENYMTSLDENNIQVTFDENILFESWQFGPGASYDVKGTHCVDKIQQDMTVTQKAEPLVVKLRSTNAYFSTFDSLNKKVGVSVHLGSRLTTVPKNEDTMRVIAIEPSGNMALQLAAGKFIEGVLRTIGLDIRTQQPKNKLLAQKASIDGSLMTIDLKNASDSFKPELVRQLLPERFYDTLMKIRSEHTMINGEWVKLNMISTMGNGFTFPLMTLCLTALIYAFRRVKRNGPNQYIDWSHTAVFGDDLIIKTDEIDFLKVLESCGLIINYDKTFCDGSFRESCGGDYDSGVDITPFYPKSLSTDPEIYIVINQVLDWSSRHFMLWGTLSYLIKLLKREPLLVPEWSQPYQGIRTVQVPTRYKYYSAVIHAEELSQDNHFACMLAVGGYIYTEGPRYLYNPRQYKTRYVMRRGRLPKGYLSGFDPEKGSYPNRNRLSNHLLLCLSSLGIATKV